MKQKSIDILVVISITVIAVVLTFMVTPDIALLRILTLPLVLILPGYALTSALFTREAFGIAERIVFSLGLSLVIGILGGLALNLTPFGLRSGSWALLLGAITLGACAVALVRRSVEADSSYPVPIHGPPGSSSFREFGLTFRQGVLLGLAALIVCGAVGVSIIGAERQAHPGFTQLWLLPTSETHSKSDVQVGVRNMEKTTMQYHLTVNENGKVVKLWSSIDLQPGENWQATFALPQAQQVGNTVVEAMLYRADAPGTLYRHVVLWLGT